MGTAARAVLTSLAGIGRPVRTGFGIAGRLGGVEIHQDRRLSERAREALRHSMQGRFILLAGAAAIVLVHTMLDVLTTYYLLRGSFDSARILTAVTMGLSAVINMILVFLMWIVFETLGRVERESDRMQTFMDTMYRRLP